MLKVGDQVIYENQIESLLIKYFEDRDIDINKDNIKQTKFKAAFISIYNTLFKPDFETAKNKHCTCNIDYNDVDTINNLVDTFINLCYEYNIIPSKDNFYRMTGITEMTLDAWRSGEHKAKIYYDLQGNRIKNIQCYKIHHGDEGYIEKDTDVFIKLVIKIEKALKDYYRSNLTESTVGQITIANNDEDVGLLYAQKEAKAKAVAWGRRPQISKSSVLGIDAIDGPPADF